MGNLEKDCLGYRAEIGESRGTSVWLQRVHKQRYRPSHEGVERYRSWEGRHLHCQPIVSIGVLFLVTY